MELEKKIGTPPVNNEDINRTHFKYALPQVLAVMVKNVLLLTYGTTIGYTTILIPGLSGNDPNEKFHLNQEQISWIGSITMMCVPMGCFLSGVATQPIGRLRAMQIINLPTIACWLIFWFCDEVWHIYFALGFSGFIGGLFEAPILTYVAEITQPHLRGLLSATAGFSIIIGVLLQFLLGTFIAWRPLALVSIIFPVLSFILLLFIPESPHWLVMNNRLKEARESLAWLRGWVKPEDVEEEFQELLKHYNVSENKPSDTQESQGVTKTFDIMSKINSIRDFTKKNFIWPLSLVSFIYFLVNFTGSTPLQTYAIKIFATLQAPIDKYHATVLLGLAQFIGCIVSVFMVHYAGKRKMAFISIGGTGLCAFIIATYAYIINVRYFSDESTVPSLQNAESYKWIPLVFIILMAFTAHCGIRALPWILIGEIYPKETRSTGCGISGAIAYIFAFSANKTFLQLVSVLSFPGMYWFYSALSLVGAITLYFILPETEGKSLQVITDHFSGISKLDNKVQKRQKFQSNGVTNAAFEDDSNQKKAESRM